MFKIINEYAMYIITVNIIIECVSGQLKNDNSYCKVKVSIEKHIN